MVKLHWAKKYFKKNQDFNPRTAAIQNPSQLLSTKTV